VSEIDSTREFLFNVESKSPSGSFTEGDLFKMENVAGFADTGVAGRGNAATVTQQDFIL
jgi:hypothetical protein